MRRKQKRLLQALGLALAALVFLPNVGLWSLARDPRPPHGAASPAQDPLEGKEKKTCSIFSCSIPANTDLQ